MRKNKTQITLTEEDKRWLGELAKILGYSPRWKGVAIHYLIKLYKEDRQETN